MPGGETKNIPYILSNKMCGNKAILGEEIENLGLKKIYFVNVIKKKIEKKIYLTKIVWGGKIT